MSLVLGDTLVNLCYNIVSDGSSEDGGCGLNRTFCVEFEPGEEKKDENVSVVRGQWWESYDGLRRGRVEADSPSRARTWTTWGD